MTGPLRRAGFPGGVHSGVRRALGVGARAGRADARGGFARCLGQQGTATVARSGHLAGT